MAYSVRTTMTTALLGRLKAQVGRVVRGSPVAANVLAGPLPALAAFRHRTDALPVVTLLCVYRRSHTEYVLRLVRAAQRAGFQIRLWALDEAAAELRSETVGSGAGSRFAILNELARHAGPGWLVVADDDISFVGLAGLRTLIAIASAQQFDIAQPAQARGSYRSHLITRQWIFASARETTFVEIGPVVAFSPQARTFVLPFPDEGMGWGIELEWATLRMRGLRLAIVDCVPILHLVPMGGTYEVHRELEQLKHRLRQHGFESFEETQHTLVIHRFA